MTNDELNEWWDNCSFKKISEIFFKECSYADEINKKDEPAMDYWWTVIDYERKLKIYETNVTKYYLIVMDFSNSHQPTYIKTEDDYDNNGFVDIDVENMSFPTKDLANEHLAKIEKYAKSKGDRYTTFWIEEN